MMSRRWLMVALALAMQSAFHASGPRLAEAQRSGQGSAQTVRVAVDVIAVDVQVIDREGHAVAGLGPEHFRVTINGRRHRVVSAAFVDARAPSDPQPGSVAGATSPPNAAAPVAGGRHVTMLAVDCLSFSPGVVRAAIETARDFITRLPAEHLVGLFAYPIGPDIDPTTDRAAVLRALDSVVGQRDVGTISQFRFRPSEIIDLSTELPQEDGPILMRIARRECAEPIQPLCVKRLSVDATSTALYYEAQANVSLGGLRSLLRKMSTMPGRKNLILISGGLIASDRAGGRPDVADLGTEAGKEAARANTAVYTIHVDTAFQERTAAEAPAIEKELTDIGRDGQVRGQWLEQFSGAAGGALFKVLGGSSEYAFDRILRETSSYYLLGVEPGASDVAGRTHEINVKVDRRNVTVRSRRWVTLPDRNTPGDSAVKVAEASPPSASSASSASTVSAPPRRVPLPGDVQPIADAFGRGDYAGMHLQLERAGDLANVIRGFRTADPPWPESPRRAAVFALELAIAGLRSESGFAREQGGRLLAEYSTRVHRVPDGDPFECAWLWTGAAALGGLFQPGNAIGFVRRALLHCPNEARLHLADAIVTEQQWLSLRQPGATETSDVMRRYEAAMKFPETAIEARVRRAWFLVRTGKPEQALELLEGAPPASTDTYVRYLGYLVRGQALRVLGRSDEAIAALRDALIAWPDAQSARVGLMTLLLIRGDRQQASALAEAIGASADDQFDPWWTYWVGDYRAYPTIVSRLRELAQ